MGSNDDLASWLDLSLVPGLGPRTYRALLSAFGLPDRIRAASRSQLARIVPDTIAGKIRDDGRAPQVAAALEWAAQAGKSLLIPRGERAAGACCTSFVLNPIEKFLRALRG